MLTLFVLSTITSGGMLVMAFPHVFGCLVSRPSRAEGWAKWAKVVPAVAMFAMVTALDGAAARQRQSAPQGPSALHQERPRTEASVVQATRTADRATELRTRSRLSRRPEEIIPDICRGC
jgi:hypothetical protein